MLELSTAAHCSRRLYTSALDAAGVAAAVAPDAASETEDKGFRLALEFIT